MQITETFLFICKSPINPPQADKLFNYSLPWFIPPRQETQIVEGDKESVSIYTLLSLQLNNKK
jgi:hypothetical protein